MSDAAWVFIVIACVFLTPVYAVYSENTEVRISRQQYLNWCLGFVGIICFLPFFIEPEGVGSIAFLLVTDVVATYFFMQKVVQRCRDAGAPKKEVYYALIPIFGLVILIALLFSKSKDSDFDQAI